MNEEERALDALKFKIHADRGFNSHLYKDKCLRRRLAVRMMARGCDGFADYSALLDRDAVEYDRLIDTLTINVTKFFRNFSMWEILDREVIPELLGDDRKEVRVWSAGCACGEEAYSVSILLREWATANQRMKALDRLTILGTDIDRKSLEAARKASYAELALDETPAHLRSRWFSDGPPYQLLDEARAGARFAHADVISDPSPTEQNLILCRNVLIYFDRATQERLFETFFEALVPGGFLVLGRVETLLGRTRSLLHRVSTRERVYRKPA